MKKGWDLIEQPKRVCEYCIYRTKWMKWLPSVTSTTNEREYGKKEKDVDCDEYLKSSKTQGL
jgi:hypothetical protein